MTSRILYLSWQGGSEFIPIPVAANDNSSSTFAFIGPQRYNRWGHGDVLYVGTTFTHHGDYRHDVPAISSRNLHDLSLAEFSFSKQSKLSIDVKFRDRFLVHYAYGFNTTDHVYFVLVQKKSHIAGDEEHGYITRLARACVSDPNFDSYAEVTLECADRSGKVLNILTAATLHESEAGGGKPKLYGAFSDTMNQSRGSAAEGRTRRRKPAPAASGVCAFSLSTIERLFEENIHHCFNGSMTHRNLEYVSGTISEGKCPVDGGHRGNIHDFCRVGIKISGKFPIRSPVIWPIARRVRSLAADEEDGQVVLLAGTEGGTILEGTIEKGATRVTSLEQYSVSSGAVLQLMALGGNVVFLTPAQMGKFPLARCDQISSCQSCAASLSPYCRWCPQSNSCATRTSCGVAAAAECVQIDRISPPELSRDVSGKNLYVHIAGLPSSKSGTTPAFTCSFSNLFVTPAKPFENGLTCRTPPFEGVSHLERVEVSISLSDTNASLASAFLPVINCGRASASCESCVTLSHSCRWCHSESACVHSDRACSSNSLASTCPVIQQKNIQVRNLLY